MKTLTVTAADFLPALALKYIRESPLKELTADEWLTVRDELRKLPTPPAPEAA